MESCNRGLVLEPDNIELQHIKEQLLEDIADKKAASADDAGKAGEQPTSGSLTP